jgi:hypothetical protein
VEHLELDVVRIAKAQDRAVCTLGDGRVGHAQVDQPLKPGGEVRAGSPGAGRQALREWLDTPGRGPVLESRAKHSRLVGAHQSPRGD